MDWSGEACDSSLLGFTRSCRGRRGVATTALGPGVTPGLVLSGGPELVLGTCESPTYKSTRGAISSGGAPLRSRRRVGKVPHLGVHPGVRVYTQVFGVLPVYSGCICEARREPLRRSGGALCSRVAPCWGSRGCSQTQGRPMGQPQGGCAAFLRAARCAQRRKTANAHFEPLAVEFPRSFLARGGSTRYGREHAPPMNICWAVVVVNQPRTGGRRFPPTTVDNKVRS